jgi:hypothetical protein
VESKRQKRNASAMAGKRDVRPGEVLDKIDQTESSRSRA